MTFEYIAPGWFFPLLDAVLKDFFIALLLVFWLLTVEKYRDEDRFEVKNKWHGFKIIAASSYLIFAIITFSWAAVASRQDPVLASPFQIPAVVVLYMITVLILFGCIVWFIVLTIRALPKIAQSSVSFARFLFFFIPTVVICLSILVGACCGNFGALTNAATSLEQAYFITLYNVYTWIFIFGFWPAQKHFDGLFPNHISSSVHKIYRYSLMFIIHTVNNATIDDEEDSVDESKSLTDSTVSEQPEQTA